MRNIKIILEYDGTRYDGWQKQGNTANTIQGKLETLLSKMTGETIELNGSGRTDAGVHALGQVANFHTESTMKIDEMEKYILTYLPKDMNIRYMEEVPLRFHSRLHAKRKQYEYRIFNSSKNPVFERKYVYHYAEKLDIEAMEEAAKLLVGEHDFKSFCGNRRLKKSTIRTIYDIQITKVGKEIKIVFEGEGFLYNMVRIMAGTLIEIGKGEKKPTDITSILEGKNRDLAGYTAPPGGLSLKQVSY